MTSKMKPEVDRNTNHEDLQNHQTSNLVLTFSAHKGKRKIHWLENLHCQ